MTITQLEAKITKLKNTYQENADVGLKKAKLLLLDAEKLQYQEGICILKHEIARGYYYSAQYLTAINYANEAYDVSIAISNYSLIVDSLNTLSCAYHELGDFQQAMSYLIKALPYSQSVSDEVYCRTLSNIGTIYKESGNYESAKSYYQKCINYVALSENSANSPQLFALLNLCDMLVDNNNSSKASNLISNVINVFFKNKINSYTQIYIYYIKAKINYTNEDYELGLSVVEKAFKLCEKTNYVSITAQLYHLKGKFLEKLNDLGQAIDYYKKAYEVYRESVMSKSLEFLLESLTNIYEKIGDYKSSYFYLEQYVEETIRMKKNRNIQKLKNIELLNEISNNKLQSEILKFKQLDLLKESGLLEKSINQVKLLSEINMYIASSNDIVEIAQRVYNRTKEFLLSTVFGIATCNFNEDTLTLNIFIKQGEAMPSYCEKLSKSKTLAARCIKEMKPVIINRGKDTHNKPVSKKALEYQSLENENSSYAAIYLPLLYENTPIGAITFRSNTIEYFQETQIKFIEVLSEYIAIAVHHATISEDLNREISEKSRIQKVLANVNDDLLKISSFDSLTGIPNRRSLENRLNSVYFEQIEAFGNMCITMIDIDRFKKYNDTYGHQQGDVCLRTIAELLTMNTDGKYSFIGRYGGEEFMLVQYNTGFDTAYSLIEEIRKQVQDIAIEHEKSEYGIVTLSFGMLYIHNISKKHTIFSLIEKADNALYSAKINGRNRIEYYIHNGVDNT